VVTPDGLLALKGPWVGRRHDAACVRLGGVELTLITAFGPLYCTVGDRGFAERWPIATVRRAPQDARVARARVMVEWAFGAVLGLFPFLTAPLQRHYQMEPSLFYSAAVLLYNARICAMRSGSIALYHKILPPLLHDYLHEPANV
jgi:hypothetical protein